MATHPKILIDAHGSGGCTRGQLAHDTTVAAERAQRRQAGSNTGAMHGRVAQGRSAGERSRLSAQVWQRSRALARDQLKQGQLARAQLKQGASPK